MTVFVTLFCVVCVLVLSCSLYTCWESFMCDCYIIFYVATNIAIKCSRTSNHVHVKLFVSVCCCDIFLILMSFLIPVVYDLYFVSVIKWHLSWSQKYPMMQFRWTAAMPIQLCLFWFISTRWKMSYFYLYLNHKNKIKDVIVLFLVLFDSYKQDKRWYIFILVVIWVT